MYDVSLTVRPVDEVAVHSRSIENMVEVMPNPDPKFSWDFPVAVAGKKVRVQLDDETEDAISSNGFSQDKLPQKVSSNWKCLVTTQSI